MKLATLIYIRRDGKTLMVHRNKKPNDMHMGKWNGMGGKLEQGESPEECAVREAREETGLELREPRLAGFITFPAFDDFEDWYVFLFTATEFSGELIESPEGHLEWIRDTDLLDLNLWDGDRVFLPWVLAGRFFSAKFEYSAGKMTKYDVVFYDRLS
jgi:8-oxo-dGTP diphosphatase